MSKQGFKVTAQSLERRFLNADNLYDRFKVLQETLAWVETLYELNTAKDEDIKQLRGSIEGYDLDDYLDNGD